MNAAAAWRSFTTVLRRDLFRQLFTAAQLTLFALMAVIVALLVLAPQLVGSSSAPPRIHAVASPEVIAAVEAAEPGWDVEPATAIPAELGADVAVVVTGGVVEVRVEKASQAAGASAVGDRFATAALAVAAAQPAPAIVYGFDVDDGDAVLTRVLTLVATLLTFSVIAGRAAWTFGALSRDLTLGLFDGVLSRTSPLGVIGGRLVAAVVGGVVQIGALGALAASLLVVVGERETALRVAQLAVPLALWAAAGIAMLVAFATVLVLLFRGGGTASLGIVVQLIGFLAFGVLIVAVLDPDAAWIGAASLIPPVSIVLLPVGVAEGRVDVGDATVAGLAMAATIGILLWLSLRVWRAATRTDDAAAMWREVFRRRRPEARVSS
ncbi:hypothetical protein [Microbacterium sp. RURRCA19A]|uniref:hypothetical protein n=1 Tax=Microbacterium sp. RURRCA19A TaxID=1907391 RepID=UPI000953B643|nr:hypothetical protein [Microbacterium sp. RURRCA19A]SIR96164.1 hypothetical protein SAMN05880568_2061 [Microbacterium sp. RURRCA19A]